ncbi:MAG: UDP-N-acetylmuramate--L-alanine ligase [Mariprofundaceae bacterium]|nr:UDP-N-acetylmuramate--L-alanine ligase [Mariprofundaceae bacterium]
MKSRVKCIHFTGIGGIGMSGIAELLHHQGFHVQGSDMQENANVLRLRELGISVQIGHDAKHLGQAQVVVVSSAISANNPELIAAREKNIAVIPRAEMLAELMRMKHGIAIAGSHGKTTMTSMIAHVMEEAGLDPTYVIGGRLTASGHNTRLGDSPYLVAEADESDGSFLHLSPMIAVVSNIDPEHLDHYGNFENLMAAFKEFVAKIPFYGRVVLHHEHPHVAALRDGLHKPVRTYGSSLQADVHLLNRKTGVHGQILSVGCSFVDDLGDFELQLPGQHNAENALAAICVLLDLGVAVDVIRHALANFDGIQRRFQCHRVGEAVLVDDYAHHPKEISATLKAARDSWPKKHIRVIFQPHRYTRTRDLMKDFLGSFDDANEVCLLPVFSAGEQAIAGASSDAMVEGMQERGHRCVSLSVNMAQAHDQVCESMAEGHIVMLLGAGSIAKLAVALRAELGKS